MKYPISNYNEKVDAPPGHGLVAVEIDDESREFRLIRQTPFKLSKSEFESLLTGAVVELAVDEDGVLSFMKITSGDEGGGVDGGGGRG